MWAFVYLAIIAAWMCFGGGVCGGNSFLIPLWFGSVCVCGCASWRQKHAPMKGKWERKNRKIWKSVKLRKRANRWHFDQSIDFILMWNPTQYNVYPRESIHPFFLLFFNSSMLLHEVTLLRSNSISKINQIILLLKMCILSPSLAVCYNVTFEQFFSPRSRVHHCSCNLYRLISECIRSIDKKVRNKHPHTFSHFYDWLLFNKIRSI